MLRTLFQVKNECIAIEDFNIISDVKSNQRLSFAIMIHCKEIVRRNYSIFKMVTLTLCAGSANVLSVSTASSLSGQWKAGKPANRKLLSTCSQARWIILSFDIASISSTQERGHGCRTLWTICMSRHSHLGCSRAMSWSSLELLWRL